MTTPDWTSEIVEAMAKELRALPGIRFSYGGAVEAARTSLTAALPMILEKAAKIADDMATEFDGGAAIRPGRMSALRIAAAIRALTEPKDNGGEK